MLGLTTQRRESCVLVLYLTVRPVEPVISLDLDLGNYIEEFMYVGSSGSTQESMEINNVR